jgi:hypothetical protein
MLTLQEADRLNELVLKGKDKTEAEETEYQNLLAKATTRMAPPTGEQPTK